MTEALDKRKVYTKKQIAIVPLEMELLAEVLSKAEKKECEDVYEKVLQERDRIDELNAEFSKHFGLHHNGVKEAYESGNIEEMEALVKDDFSVCRQKVDDLNRTILQIELYICQIDIVKAKFELDRLRAFRAVLVSTT